ncbi:MAG TPA: efflux RND transporter permease subunit [Gelria sp.]|jgi:multidrug efflux pump|nr:efflux RND transporter permease subunit [Gelria sp.]
MIRGILSKIIGSSRFITVFIILSLVLGLYSYYLLPKQESPEVLAPVAMISTIYPGASPQEVERLVTRVVESNIRKLAPYDFSESYSKNSVSVVVLQLQNDAPVEKSWNELRRILTDTQRELPPECLPIQINTDLAETAGIIISLSGKHYNPEELAAMVEKFKKRLEQVEGIARFEIFGEEKKRIEVEIDHTRLAASGLSLEELFKILQAQNVVIPPGAIVEEGIKTNVQIPGWFNSLDDIENSIIGVSPDGSVKRLKDIANIRWEVEPDRPLTRHNGQSALLLTGYFEPEKNILLVGKNLQDELDQLKSEAPYDMLVDQVLFQPDEVNKNIYRFLLNLLEGIILVIMVVLLGMGWKNALVASTAIPLSIMLSFMAMYLLGIKVHEISIAALIIVLGILVDDAIVMVDAIQVGLDKGLNRMEACLQGLKQAAIPILTATLVTIIAFSPIFALPGAPGEFLKSLPQIVLIALTASYVVAMLITPAMAYRFFDPGQRRKDDWLRNFFAYLLNKSMARKKTAIISSLLIFGLAVYALTFMGLQFFPSADKDLIYIDINAQAGSTRGKTEELLVQVEDILSREGEVLAYTSAVGSGVPKFYITVPVSPQAQDFAQVMLRIRPQSVERFQNNEELASYLQEKLDSQISAGNIKVKLLEKAFPVAPVQVRISGEQRENLRQIAEQIKSKLKQIPGSRNVEDDAEKEIQQLVVQVDTEKASQLGISNYDIQRQTSLALEGARVSVLRREGKQYNILLRSDIDAQPELEKLSIKSPISGRSIPLQEIASIEAKPQLSSIKKYDGQNSIKVRSDIRPGYSAVEIEKELKDKLSSVELSGATLLYDGEYKQIKDNFGILIRGALVALFLIYLMLVLQFHSFIQPLVIFLTIPLALIGSVLGLLLLRQPLSFMAFIGMVSLTGLVIRNAILLIDFINDARSRGLVIEKACEDAVERRFRPIVLSAVTTTVGLVPLALSGSSLFVPLAIALIFGLLVATLLTMVIIPVVYSLLVRENTEVKA